MFSSGAFSVHDSVKRIPEFCSSNDFHISILYSVLLCDYVRAPNRRCVSVQLNCLDGNLLLGLRHNCNVEIYLSDKMVTGDTLWIGALHVYRKKEALVFDFFCSSLLRSGCRNM